MNILFPVNSSAPAKTTRVKGGTEGRAEHHLESRRVGGGKRPAQAHDEHDADAHPGAGEGGRHHVSRQAAHFVGFRPGECRALVERFGDGDGHAHSSSRADRGPG
jgi:hypothetical protein